MNKNNPIVKLVNKGMQMEKRSDAVQAQVLFIQAWDEASNDWEKCIAAHFVARHQDSPKNALKWNRESLRRADKVENKEIKSYYPSIYVNIGISYEELRNYEKAKKYYDLAFKSMSYLPANNRRYSREVKEVILERRGALDHG